MRYPAVANQFYPAEMKELNSMLKKYFENAKVKEKNAKAVIAPHAGYIFSGQVAAYSYSAIKKSYNNIPKIVVLGPNHTGMGSLISLSLDNWETPIGIAECDIELAKKILKCNMIDAEENAHRFEHSIEVQLPFLNYIYGKKVKFVAICMAMHDPSTAREIGKSIADAGADLVIASSDFTHYESAENVNKKDSIALKFVEKLDENGFYQSLQKTNATVCGPGPIMAAISFAKEKGAKTGKILKMANSGDITGDYSSVVNYVSAVME